MMPHYSADGRYYWDGYEWVPVTPTSYVVVRPAPGHKLRNFGCLLLILIIAFVAFTGTGIALRGDPVAWLPRDFPGSQQLRQWARDLGLISPSQASVLAQQAIPPGPRPIIFIPGIMGSYLTDSNGNETWPDLQGIADTFRLIDLGDINQVGEFNLLSADALQLDGSLPAGDTVDVPNGVNNPAHSESQTPLLAGVVGAAWCSREDPGLSLTPPFIVKQYCPPIAHYYDDIAANAARSGYVVASSDDQVGLSRCAGIRRCFVPVGVDFRRSASFNAARVLSVINDVLRFSKSDRVDIVAHSQGGLIANALVHTHGSAGKIYRIVTLGTPFLGAPKVLDALLYRAPCSLFNCKVDMGVIQSLIENYPGVAELLPSPDYFAAYGASNSPLIEGTDVSLSYNIAQQIVASELEQLPTPGTPRDTALVDAARSFHNGTDRWSPLDDSVGLLRMVGYDSDAGNPNCDPATACDPGIIVRGLATIGGIYMPSADYVANEDSLPPDCGDCDAPAVKNVDGDGTVPLLSASLYNPATHFDDRGSGHNMYWCGYSHMGLAQATKVWQAALSYLEGSPNFTTDMLGATCPDGTEGTIAQTGLLG